MLLHYLVKCTQRIVHVKPSTFCARKHQTLYSAGPVASKQPRSESSRLPVRYEIWIIVQRRVYKTKIRRADERRWSTSGVALNSRLSTWLMTTGTEDSKRASVRKEDTLNPACELTILIWSISVTFSLTFVWLLPCYIFHSKGMLQRWYLHPCLFYRVVQSGCGGIF